MQSKVEPPSLDPAEEPLLWEGLTLNKCILVASVVALLSVTFQVLQGESGGGRSGKGRPDRAATPWLRPLLSCSSMLQGGTRPRPAGASATSRSRWVRPSPIPRAQPETGPHPRLGWPWEPPAGISHS